MAAWARVRLAMPAAEYWEATTPRLLDACALKLREADRRWDFRAGRAVSLLIQPHLKEGADPFEWDDIYPDPHRTAADEEAEREADMAKIVKIFTALGEQKRG